MEEDYSDLDTQIDTHRMNNILCGGGENELEFDIRCESAEGYSPSEASSYQQHLTPHSTCNVENSFSLVDELTPDPVEEEVLVITNLVPSMGNAILLNEAYQSTLMELAQQLEVLLNANLHKQKKLNEEIEELKSKANKKTEKTKKKLITFSFFGMPYFKDAAYNTPPPNADTLLAQNLGFRNISLLLLNKPFSKFEDRKIRKGLKEQAIVLESTRLVGLRDELQKQLDDPSVSKDEMKDINSEITSIQREIYNIRLLPDDKLFDVPPTAFDWHKISIQNFGRTRTPDQLRLHWMHYLRPGVDTSSWNAIDNKMLKDLVSKYDNGVDWDEVAKSMNKERTPFECFRRYQEKFNIESRKFGWSNEENDLLLSLVSSYRTQNISEIYWEEIRQNFPGKSKTQIYAHFRYHFHSLNPTPFSSQEDIVILEGIKIGFDLADISLLLGRRSLIQIRNRLKALQKKPNPNDKNWTEEEDKKLLDMPDAGHLRAHLNRKNFPGRGYNYLNCRFHFLRMKLTSVKEYVAQLKDEKMYLERRYLPKENRKLASLFLNMMSRIGYNREVNSSLLKKLPMMKTNLLNDSEERNRKKRNKYAKFKIQRSVRGKRVIARKENVLKQILRPYMAPNTKRPRKLCFPGDGREHGIVFSCLYRLLHCNFKKAPNTNDLDEDEAEEHGIAYENYLSFIEMRNITKDLPLPVNAERVVTRHWLPPSLGTLIGYRGLDLHRDYLKTSASSPFVQSENTAAVEELDEEDEADPMESPSGQPELDGNDEADPMEGPSGQPELDGDDEEADPMEGPSGQSELMPEASEVEEPDASESSEQKEANSDDGENSDPQDKSNDINFGDENSDRILLSRMMTLFYWPGIVSSMYVPELTKEDPTPEEAAAEVAPKSPPTKVKPPNKKATKVKRKEHLRRLALNRFGKCKALNDSAVSTTSAEDLNSSAVSTGADGENSESVLGASTSAGPSEADGAEIAPPPKKRVRKIPAKGTTPKVERVTRRSTKK